MRRFSSQTRKTPLPLIAMAAGLVACGGDTVVGPQGAGSMARVRASNSFTCALGENEGAVCWGSNDMGQLGSESIADELSPRAVSGGLRFRELSTKASGRHVCGIITAGAAYCWGENTFGQLGDGSRDSRVSPQQVLGGLSFTSISAGWRFTCGLTADGAAHCWGRGEWGQLGDGLATGSLTPVAVTGGHRFAKIEVGSNNLVCGLTDAARILCWGLDIRGSIGAPSSEICTRSDGLQLKCAATPQPISSESRFRDVTSGSAFACGITETDVALCWGSNGLGQLGTATTEVCVQAELQESPCSPVPVEVSGGHHFSMVAAGVSHACGVTRDGDTYCWGSNTFGQLGNGLLGDPSNIPVPVTGGLTFVSVSAGDNHSCGETTDGKLYCWGANDRGQLGTGNRNIGLGPLAVVDAVGAS